jgi:microcystin-dependent protein
VPHVTPDRRASRLLSASAASLLAVACMTLPAAAVATSAPSITGVSGGSQPFDNMQPSLALTQFVATTGIYPQREGFASSVGIGAIRTFAGNYVPYGEPLADGRLLPIQSYAATYSVMGNTYGGDFRTNFAVPDLAGRTIVHAGTGTVAPGDRLGEIATTLATAQLPAHSHLMPDPGPGRATSTDITGHGLPVSNLQPSTGIHYVIALQGSTPVPGGSGATGDFIGRVTPFAGTFAPGSLAFADGQLLAISEHADLYSVLGTRYGGDGVATFALPDLRGRTIIGAGAGPGLSPVTLGQSVGAAEIVLSEAQMPAHTHALLDAPAHTDATGGGQPFDNRQPALALSYLIATQGAYPSRDCCDSADPVPSIGEITAFAGDFAPAGWSFADGRLLQISTNAALFSILGTTYGGDGVRTFALPDLRGRIVVGAGGDIQVGTTFGAESVVLGQAQLPLHLHTVPVPEPDTYALIAAGLVLVGGVSRRRRASSAR